MPLPGQIVGLQRVLVLLQGDRSAEVLVEYKRYPLDLLVIQPDSNSLDLLIELIERHSPRVGAVADSIECLGCELFGSKLHHQLF